MKKGVHSKQKQDQRANNPDLSHNELEDRFDKYIKLAKDKDPSFELQSMLKDYRKEKQERSDNHLKSDIHYALGDRIYLQQAPHKRINDDRENIEQKIRNAAWKDGKEVYDQNHSLKKEFEDIPSISAMKRDFVKNKDKGMSRDR